MSQFVNRYMHPFRVEEKTITGLLGEYFCITPKTLSRREKQRILIVQILLKEKGILLILVWKAKNNTINGNRSIRSIK